MLPGPEEKFKVLRQASKASPGHLAPLPRGSRQLPG